MLLQDWQVEDILQVGQELSNNRISRFLVMSSQLWFYYNMTGEAWLRVWNVCQCVLALGLFW